MKALLTSLVCLSYSLVLLSQTPEAFNYQAVLRDSNSEILENQPTQVTFNIRQFVPNGTVLYSEEHMVTTNEFGLVNLKVGTGTLLSGDFTTIKWAMGPHFLEVLLNGFSVGVEELSSVPYSLFAKHAGIAMLADAASIADSAAIANFANSANKANVSNTAVTAGVADFATIAGTAIDDNDRSPENELQSLSIIGNRISLSRNGGTINLPNSSSPWKEIENNIYSTNAGNIGIKTSSPETTLQIQTKEREGEEIQEISQINPGPFLWAPNVWQSFTSTQNGFLSTIGVISGRVGTEAASWFRIYEGEGTSGEILHEQQYASFISGGVTEVIKFAINSPVFVEAGMKYTILFSELGWVESAGEYLEGISNVGADLTFQVDIVSQVTDNTTLAVGYGRVGIGTNAPREKLEVVGNICYTGTSGACSDERYKKDFVLLGNVLEKVKQLNGLYYHWRQEDFPEQRFSDDRQIGVIAQEVEALFPEIVLTGEDGYKSVDYGRLTPILLEAIKEQQELIEAMEADYKTLKTNMMARLEALEGKMLDQTNITSISKE